ncbi:MAG: site-specific DNA-methyltransferase [bacterium]|nr:site-specific DNA-methyltransferase [bacterium]
MERRHLESVSNAERNVEKLATLFPECVVKIEGTDGYVRRVVDFERLRELLTGVPSGDSEACGMDCLGSELAWGQTENKVCGMARSGKEAALAETGKHACGMVRPSKGAASTQFRKRACNLTWPGKEAALARAQKQTCGLLHPCPEVSINWDTTRNLYLEGDNLEMLKILQESHLGKIKMIYIDPPYNTGTALIYKDRFTTTIQEYKNEAGQTDGAGSRQGKGATSRERCHSDWCSMIYPRLALARELLTEDGVIFISIDDNELIRLGLICEEIFGEANRLACFVWQTKRAARGVPPRTMVMSNHEYVLCFAKDIEKVKFRGLTRRLEDFANPDNDPRGPWRSESLKATGRQNNYFSLVDPQTGHSYYANWAFSKASLERIIAEKLVLFPKDPRGTPRQKKFFNSYLNENKALVTSLGWYSTEKATKALMELFDNKKIFDFPKPSDLIKFFIGQTTAGDDTILDFFSGSATTAHAVMQLNAEDGERRRFIMVQIPESCPPKSEAAKNGYKNICEIGRERIRRAGLALACGPYSQSPSKSSGAADASTRSLDIGFRVFRMKNSSAPKSGPDSGFKASPEANSQDHLKEQVSFE